MLKKERRYTFIVASHSRGRIWRVSLPLPVLVCTCILLIIGAVGAGIAAQDYIRMLGLVTDYGRILAQNDSFRSENHNYRIQTAQLGEKIDFLETTARKLMVLSGINSREGIGGVGGISKENLTKPVAPEYGTLQAIDGYNKTVSDLEDRYKGLTEYISEKTLVAAATPSFLPVRGYVTGGIGRREDPFNGSNTDFHTGVDISAPYGSRVIAPADGTVLFAGRRAGYGNIVVIDHKFGILTRYGHLWRCNVQAGQHISRNDVIGYVGTSGRTTGPHLHFELWAHNRLVNPLTYFRNVNKRIG